jgi:type I restriction enzyme R subunit
MDISERNFEGTIEAALLAHGPDSLTGDAETAQDPPLSYGQSLPGGYHKRRSDEYNRSLCLIPRDVIDFIYATQPKEWEKLKTHHGQDVKERFLTRLAHEMTRRGTPDVLRKGLRDTGCKFQLAYFRPSSGLNAALQKLYAANLFTVVRQLQYSEKTGHSLDLTIFLNGLPIFTAELKNPLKGQNVEDAIRQYRFDRDTRESFFAFGRCLAHFAVDPDLVYMTTHLDGVQTRFLPFNKGRHGGSGNLPSWKSFATAYLWEEVWARDSVLNLIQHFIHVVDDEDDKGRKTGTHHLIFPRYHQLDSVRRLVTHARAHGPGQRYLIQHSAGSGKSNSIAWLAHQLSVLHNADDQRVFDSIIVITDRRVLDRQLQRTVRQFQQTLGIVENIDKTSHQLKEALEGGKTIIVTTLQKFPVIAGQMSALPGKRFAVIVDEAHSSQTGESTKSLKSVLTANTLEEAEKEERDEEGDDLEDRLVEEMQKRGHQPHVSTFAFTATPKQKTLELFGTCRPDGSYTAFSLYSMRQAIEEQYILDVLKNYTTYTTYWNLLKKIEDDPRYDRTKATYLLKLFVDLHEHAIAHKVALMVEHFMSQVAHGIGGKAKAMIVTRSRLHAVRYKLAVDQYLKEHGAPFKALVAFSGTVRDGGKDYTEANMNGFPETQTAHTFGRDEYRFLIVANKFQTGFDQPLLHTMYVDKKLGGVHAVQTLSRLNRVHPGKDETMVLDFANDASELQKAFQPYYETTILSEGTDPNLLYDRQTQLADFHVYTDDEATQVSALYYDPKGTQDKLHAAVEPIVERYKETAAEEQAEFRSQLNDYIRLYAFLSQVVTFTDPDLEKLYVFARVLIRKLPVDRDQLPLEIQQNVDMDSYRLQRTHNGSIALERGTTPLTPMESHLTQPTPSDVQEPLSQIIEELNERFGTDFTEDDKVFIRQLEEHLESHTGLEASIRVNPPENARLTFEHVVHDQVQEMIDANFKFYKQITDDEDFSWL